MRENPAAKQPASARIIPACAQVVDPAPTQASAAIVRVGTHTLEDHVESRSVCCRMTPSTYVRKHIMPTIRLAVPPNAWTKEEKAKVVGALTDALAQVAQECGKGDIKQFIGVQVDETAEGGYAIGGQIFG